MQRTLARNISRYIGQDALVSGWVNSKRNHGKIAFLDIRDRSGIIQAVILPGHKDYERAAAITIESVVEVTGQVSKRPSGMENKDIVSGMVELKVDSISQIGACKRLPFEISDTRAVDEELRLKYRYLDLRSHRMSNNLQMRHKVNQFVRSWLTKNDFIEVETPFLTKSTPEGARDFLVPSRLHPGKFYALPQSPQQYKQLLMVAGVERYFQLVRNFRDEDQRGDRQPEFTQIDIEAGFVDEEEIIRLNEKFIRELVSAIYPKKKFTLTPFPRIKYYDAMARYKSDRPDLRKDKKNSDELCAIWITDFPMFEKKEDGTVGATHHPFTAMKDDFLADFENYPPGKVSAKQYDLVINGNEVAGGSMRTTDPKILMRVFKFLGHTHDEISAKFGHLLEAYEYGAPNHGGIAWGYDRLMMILQNEKNIREAMAFPKTGEGKDPLMNSPCDVDDSQLKEVKLQIIK